MPDKSIVTALLLEKANLVKQKIALIDKEAGDNDKLFRTLILKWFEPDKKF